MEMLSTLSTWFQIALLKCVSIYPNSIQLVIDF